MKKKREEEKKKRKKKKKRKGMETMILVWIIGLLDFCMEKSNHKSFFFFMNLGLKEPYLVYWWCLAVLD